MDFLALLLFLSLTLTEGQIVVNINAADKQTVVDAHNAHRRDVPQPPNTSPKMLYFIWDEALAKFAQAYADSHFPNGCGAALGRPAFEHNPYRVVPGQILLGEVGYTGLPVNVVSAWWKCMGKPCVTNGWRNQSCSETHNFLGNNTYSENGVVQSCECAQAGKCSHATEILWAATARIGCGYRADCATFCNYHPSGNNIPNFQTPVNTYGPFGASCSQCPDGYNTCDDRLCKAELPPIQPTIQLTITTISTGIYFTINVTPNTTPGNVIVMPSYENSFFKRLPLQLNDGKVVSPLAPWANLTEGTNKFLALYVGAVATSTSAAHLSAITEWVSVDVARCPNGQFSPTGFPPCTACQTCTKYLSTCNNTANAVCNGQTKCANYKWSTTGYIPCSPCSTCLLTAQACTKTSNTVCYYNADTTTTLIADPQPALEGSWSLLLATVTSPGPIPTGSIKFRKQTSSGWITVTDVPLNASGVATYTYSGYGVGSENFRADYSGTEYTSPNQVWFNPSSGTFTFRSARETTCTLVSSPAPPLLPTTTISFRFRITNSTGQTPAGGVKFYNGTQLLTNVPVSVLNGGVTYSTKLQSGTKIIRADYTGTGYAACSQSVTVTIDPAFLATKEKFMKVPGALEPLD